jgi:hypothetical protein
MRKNKDWFARKRDTFSEWKLAVADNVYIRTVSGSNISAQTYNTVVLNQVHSDHVPSFSCLDV